MTSRREFLLYIDDSGSRDPDRHSQANANAVDWFALGGVLVDAADKDRCDQAIAAFRQSWPQLEDKPLRSYDIRNLSGGFRWLAGLSRSDQQAFYKGISDLIVGLPVVVVGCVVHRPGYNARYLQKYGQRRWKLCKTAFNIVVERAAKFAAHHDSRLRVYVERTDKVTESQLKEYYDQLKTSGSPFDEEKSAKYSPMQAATLSKTLYDFKVKTKASDLMQLADLCLFPICVSRYRAHPSFDVLQDSGKLLDAHCTAENGLFGIKYFCFDDPETQKPAVMRA